MILITKLNTMPGRANWLAFKPEDFMTINSLSLSNFEKEIKIPKKTPKEILIESHAGILRKDNFIKSKKFPPFSKINFIDLND